MNTITKGVKRFRDEIYPSNGDLFAKLATGQKPNVLFITCSDSRIVPEMLTQTGPGELFIIRNAGNIVPPFSASAGGEEATIEYAVAVLKVEHIIVCGHSDCGAMKALRAPEGLSSVPSVARWLELARPTRQVADACCPAHFSEGEKLNQLIELNTLRQLENLRSHPWVASALAEKKLQLHAWVYDIGSGRVTTYDQKAQCFKDLEDELQAVEQPLTLAV